MKLSMVRFFGVLSASILILSGCAEQNLAVPQARVITNSMGSTVPAAPATSSSKIIEPTKKSATSTRPIQLPDQSTKSTPTALPVTLDYAVPFVSQAPFGVWDSLHEEACEEASMIMVAAYFNHTRLTPHVMEQGILDLIKWEEQRGYHVDVTAAQTATILKSYFKLKATVTNNVDTANILAALGAGKLIVVPAAGRRLGNPYYTAPGPLYHMLVIRGYDERSHEFITNDPGTKRGEAYRYSYAQLLNAVADWNTRIPAEQVTEQDMAAAPKALVLVSQ